MKNFANINEAAVYCGTYKKYNEGSLYGDWLKLSDYDSKEDFITACLELHEDENDPELMFQDWENIPEGLCGESWIDEKVWDFIHMIDENDIDGDALEAYFELGLADNYEDADDILEDFRERYEGHFETDYDFGYYWYECGCIEIPESIVNYFDFERYGRDVAFDYHETNGYYFRAY